MNSFLKIKKREKIKMPVAINFKICDNSPECSGIEVCPTGALFWDEENKKIGIDNSKCISCEKCPAACPVEAIRVAKDSEEFEKIKKEIQEDPRRISDLFVDRYGAVPIDPDTLIEAKDFDKILKLEKPVLVEFFNEDSIMCLRKSIPISELVKHKDILFRKVRADEKLLREFEVKELPALLFFKNKNLVGKIEGYFERDEKEKFEDKINNLLDNEVDEGTMWEKLETYFRVGRVLDIGVSFQDCPNVILENAKQIERITINKDLLKIGIDKYSYPNVNYKLMAAEDLKYDDGYFDVIFTSSYHEFDQSIQQKALEDMYRALKKGGVLIFVEPMDSSVTNDLFKVFDPNENHAGRIKESFDRLDTFANENSMAVLLKGRTKLIDRFESKENFEDTMLEWWSDIKIPANESEKNAMVEQIDKILDKAGMLNKLKIEEDTLFIVLKKP
jgi:Fe-S-cluster-containing hydrogenase component 2/ubiquinone/menaquinone biosynthesis C-methylase UbiE